jgi:hypothetical protein
MLEITWQADALLASLQFDFKEKCSGVVEGIQLAQNKSIGGLLNTVMNFWVQLMT